jgi:hypothetical protein
LTTIGNGARSTIVGLTAGNNLVSSNTSSTFRRLKRDWSAGFSDHHEIMADDDFAVEMLGRGIAPGRIAHFCSARHQWQLPSTPDKSASVSAKALEMLKRSTLRWDFAAGFSAGFD